MSRRTRSRRAERRAWERRPARGRARRARCGGGPRELSSSVLPPLVVWRAAVHLFYSMIGRNLIFNALDDRKGIPLGEIPMRKGGRAYVGDASTFIAVRF